MRERFGIKPLFAWYDLWVGAFWDRDRRRLYLLPIPMVGVVVQFPTREVAAPPPSHADLAREAANAAIRRLQARGLKVDRLELAPADLGARFVGSHFITPAFPGIAVVDAEVSAACAWLGAGRLQMSGWAREPLWLEVSDHG